MPALTLIRGDKSLIPVEDVAHAIEWPDDVSIFIHGERFIGAGYLADFCNVSLADVCGIVGCDVDRDAALAIIEAVEVCDRFGPGFYVQQFHDLYPDATGVRFGRRSSIPSGDQAAAELETQAIEVAALKAHVRALEAQNAELASTNIALVRENERLVARSQEIAEGFADQRLAPLQRQIGGLEFTIDQAKQRILWLRRKLVEAGGSLEADNAADRCSTMLSVRHLEVTP